MVTQTHERPAEAGRRSSGAPDAPPATDELLSQVDGSASELDAWLETVEGTARDLADRLAAEVQQHPFRTLALAKAAGFLLASLTRSRTVMPALVKSGLGIAAAVALRQLAEQGLGRLGVDFGSAEEEV